MSFDELRDFVERVDVGAYFSFLHCVAPEDRNREGMLKYLLEHEPFLFRLAESVAEAYQNALFVALRQTDALIESYTLLKAARNTIESMESSLTSELQKQSDKGTPAEEKKRARRKKTPNESVREHDQAVERVTKCLKVAHAAEKKFYAREKFSSDFGFEKYVHVVRKGKIRKDITILKESTGWETIYHCNGPWQAEQLVEELKDEGRRCLIIKRARGGMDQEVLSYKVIATGPE